MYATIEKHEKLHFLLCEAGMTFIVSNSRKYDFYSNYTTLSAWRLLSRKLSMNKYR